MRSEGDGASSAGSNGDGNGGVLRRRRTSVAAAFWCSAGYFEVSKEFVVEWGFEGCRQCGSAVSYDDVIDRRISGGSGASPEIQMPRPRHSATGKIGIGGAGFPWGPLRAYGVPRAHGINQGTRAAQLRRAGVRAAVVSGSG